MTDTDQSQKCQSQAWKRGHKYECKILASQRDVVPASVRALMQALHAMQHKHLDNAALQYFMRLESNADTVLSGPSGEDIAILVHGAWKYAGEPSSADETVALLIMCIVRHYLLSTLLLYGWPLTPLVLDSQQLADTRHVFI